MRLELHLHTSGGTKEEIRHNLKRTKNENREGRWATFKAELQSVWTFARYVWETLIVPSDNYISHTLRMRDIKIPTLNISGITAPTRMEMLSEFTKFHELETLFFREVTNAHKLKFRG